MKKFFALVLTILMILSLVACGSNNATSDDGKNTDNTQKSEQTEQTSDNGNKNNSTKANAAEAALGLNLPKNVKIKSPGGTIYKIGDDFMVDYGGGSEYDFYRYNGKGEYDYYYWNNNAFESEGDTVTLETIIDFAIEEDAEDREKIDGDTKEICGRTCQAYKDVVNIKYYVDEETGLYLEMWMNGATNAGYVITEWDTTITEFPTSAPEK